jgi:CRISPR-associated exonuclease Cas4
MEWADDDRIMISALEHYAYCPRQCALIHVEQSYEENIYTLRGNRDHERVDLPLDNTRDDVRIVRSLPLYSDRLGLVGRADVVEFQGETPYPVEYKHGAERYHRPARIQLCAQALCLEEMTGMSVDAGAIYHTGARRRQEVELDASLRQATEDIVAEVRAMLESNRVPPPVNDDRCPPCSLQRVCMPEPMAASERQAWWQRALFRIDDPPGAA